MQRLRFKIVSADWKCCGRDECILKSMMLLAVRWRNCKSNFLMHMMSRDMNKLDHAKIITRYEPIIHDLNREQVKVATQLERQQIESCCSRSEALWMFDCAVSLDLPSFPMPCNNIPWAKPRLYQETVKPFLRFACVSAHITKHDSLIRHPGGRKTLTLVRKSGVKLSPNRAVCIITTVTWTHRQKKKLFFGNLKMKTNARWRKAAAFLGLNHGRL